MHESQAIINSQDFPRPVSPIESACPARTAKDKRYAKVSARFPFLMPGIGKRFAASAKPAAGRGPMNHFPNSFSFPCHCPYGSDEASFFLTLPIQR
jgi:hypothetical protein